ncbi:MAG: MG2 domain-containing protein, partial [Fimbriimonadales bacterium]|nr:MG2 domain-containing protein [Fimbriimonadales bacterium]
EVREGERVEVDLPMTPPDPFLELVHPQAVYYPDEPLRVGIRGFHYEDTMRLTLYRVRSEGTQPPPLALHNFLSDLRYGWWHPSRSELRKQMERFRPSMQVVWEEDAPVRGRDPEGVYIQYVSLPRQPEGTYVLTIEAGDLIQAALICLSSVGVVSKSGQGIVEVWCTDLRTGQPIPNAEVRIFGRHFTGGAKHEPTAVRAMAAGRTNAQGLWRVQIGSLAGEEWRKPMLAVRSPRSGALVHWGRLHIGGYSHAEEAEPLVGTLYPERPIYRPGDAIHIKGIARLGSPPDYRLPPPGTPVTISIINPREELVYETRTTTSPMGSFHFDFRTSPEAETGFYQVVARVGNYGTLSASVPLSAYRKPTYRILVKPSNTLYMPGETVRAEIRTEYYFGMPVPNTRLVYTLYRREKFLWEESLYSAVDYVDAETDVYEDEYSGEGSYGQVVATGELDTDAAGRAVLRLPAEQLLPQPDADDMPDWAGDSLSYAYTLEVFALSEGWEGAKGSAEFE